MRELRSLELARDESLPSSVEKSDVRLDRAPDWTRPPLAELPRLRRLSDCTRLSLLPEPEVLDRELLSPDSDESDRSLDVRLELRPDSASLLLRDEVPVPALDDPEVPDPAELPQPLPRLH